MQVGFIGLGRMGSAMAANLLAAGHALTVYNRTLAKAQAARRQGRASRQDARRAARGDVVITMLADDRASSMSCSASTASSRRSRPARSISR